MKSLQFYKYTTWSLLVLNLILVGLFFFRSRPPYPPLGERPTDRLKLDKAQNSIFFISAKKHASIIEELQATQKKLLSTYFNQLIKQQEEVRINHILDDYESLERQKIQATYEHFKEIKNSLREEQYVNFEDFMADILSRVLPKSKKNNHPPKDF